MAGRSDETTTRVAARLRAAALVVAVAGLALAALTLVPRDPDALRDSIDGAGVVAPLAFAGAAAMLTVALFPFPVVAAAGGLLFGVAEGAALAVTGETIGATGALLLARHGLREPVARAAGPRLTALLDGVARRGFSAVLLVRVLPGVPRHPANYVFGITTVRVRAFAPATVLGTAPRALGYAALGGTLGDLTSPASVAAVAGLAAFGALGLWGAARDPELRALLRAWRDRRRRRG